MHWKQKHSSLAVIIVGFAILFFIFRKQWMLLPISVSVLGFALSSIGDFVHIIWMNIAKVLGWINSRIILSILFFLVLTPISLLMKLFNGNRFLQKKEDSMFIERNHVYQATDFEKTF